jgi:hypothetical protein
VLYILIEFSKCTFCFRNFPELQVVELKQIYVLPAVTPTLISNLEEVKSSTTELESTSEAFANAFIEEAPGPSKPKSSLKLIKPGLNKVSSESTETISTEKECTPATKLKPLTVIELPKAVDPSEHALPSVNAVRSISSARYMLNSISLNQAQSQGKLFDFRTSMVVVMCLVFAVLHVIYHKITESSESKKVLMKTLMVAIKIAVLIVPHFWVYRSEEIYKYVKRKLNAAYDLYFGGNH